MLSRCENLKGRNEIGIHDTCTKRPHPQTPLLSHSNAPLSHDRKQRSFSLIQGILESKKRCHSMLTTPTSRHPPLFICNLNSQVTYLPFTMPNSPHRQNQNQVNDRKKQGRKGKTSCLICSSLISNHSPKISTNTAMQICKTYAMPNTTR